MRTAPACVAVLGLATAAFAGSNPLMDQIGLDDGSSIDPANILANQYFEAAFSVYDIGVVDDFDNPDGLAATSMQMVISGWNGYTGIDRISGLQANFYSDYNNAGTSLAGDLGSEDFPGVPTADPNWSLAGYDLLGVQATAPWNIGVGTVSASMIPTNEFGANGQTGCAISTIGDLQCWQANPNGGFGFGSIQTVASNAAYRVLGGSGNPCDLPLPPACQADVNGANGVPDGIVGVDDVLMIIETYGQSGNGDSRPQGDCAPLPNGDCTVDVNDLLLCIEQYGSDCAPRGACCFGVDGCTEDQTEADCSDLAGQWLGQGSSCATCVSGACCLGDSSCIQAVPEDCFNAGGAYQGDSSTCGNCPPVPDNNDCSGALDIGNGGLVAFDNTGATTSGDIIDPCDADTPARQIYQDLWYSVTADVDGNLIVSSCDATTLDTVIAVYDSCGGTVLACNDDGAECADFTSFLSIPASAGDTYIVRFGSYAWNDTASFEATIEVTPETPGACCIGNIDCYDGLVPTDCDAFGGVYQGADTTCDSISCGWAGCESTDTPEGVPCQEDTDAAGANADPNGGLNVDPPVYGNISDGETICGSASTFLCAGCSADGTDATYRDTDWYLFSNPEGGEYTVEAGGQGPLLVGIVDLNAVAFVATFTTEANSEGSLLVTLPAGDNYCVWVGHDFNAGFETPCGTNQDEYSVSLSYAPADPAACCVDGVCIGDYAPSACAAQGGEYIAGESCDSGYQCAVPYEGCTATGQEPLDPSEAWTAGSADATYGYLRYASTSVGSMSSMRVWGLTLAYNGGWATCEDPDMTLAIGAYEDSAGLPGNALAESSATPVQAIVDVVYAGVYPLHRFDVDLSANGNIAWVKAASESDGLGDCWFLWISSTLAGEGTSVFDNLGTITVEDYGLAHCIYE